MIGIIIPIILCLIGCSLKINKCDLTFSKHLDSLNVEIVGAEIYGLRFYNNNSLYDVSYYSPIAQRVFVKKTGHDSILFSFPVNSNEDNTFTNYKIINKDTIILVYQNEDSTTFQFNIGGKTQFKDAIEVIFKVKGKRFTIYDYSKYFDFEYNNATQKLIIPTHSYETWYGFEYFNTPILMTYAPFDTTNKIKLLNIKYPAEYRLGHYGQAFTDYRCINEKGNFIYSFNISPDIFEYNPITDKTVRHKLNGKIAGTTTKQLDTLFQQDFNMIFKHLDDNSIFEQICFDPFRKLYYRLYTVGLDNIKNINTKEVKNQYNLLVYNSDFELLKEIELGPTDKISNAFQIQVSEKGLFIPYINDDKKSNKRFFDIYNFSPCGL